MKLENLARANEIHTEVTLLKKLIYNWEISTAIVGSNVYTSRLLLMHECIGFERIQECAIAGIIVKIGELEIEAESL